MTKTGFPYPKETDFLKEFYKSIVGDKRWLSLRKRGACINVFVDRTCDADGVSRRTARSYRGSFLLPAKPRKVLLPVGSDF